VPTYQYACTDCGDKSEVVQRFTDEPLTVCSVCGGKLRKVFSPVGIVFKGSGFYRTDSRSSGNVPAGSSSNGSGGSGGSGGSPSSESSSSPGSDKSSNGSSSSGDSAKSSSSSTSSSDGGKKPAATSSS
jgi:putative FmdB family regulatory protein